MRNTKVISIGREMEEFGCEVDYLDPWADATEVMHEYGVKLIPSVDPKRNYHAIIACVAHDEFADFVFTRYKMQGAIVYDVKGVLPRDVSDARL